ncbi:MAG: hypothetical protein KIT20_02155 [Alphaproteobacteria bacterium]|nr:hypothetical protein [Alphaproteobacteria bacterium]
MTTMTRRLDLPLIFGGILILNGAAMFAAPGFWFATLPGVAESGPFNAHFVRDVGAAYIAVGLAIALARRLRGLPAGFAYLPPALFLLLHAATHLVEAGHHGPPGGLALGAELIGVYLPALLLLRPVGRALAEGGFAALKPEAQIRAMEKMLGVPLAYMRDVARQAPHVYERLKAVSGLMREPMQAPKDVLAFAALGAVLEEDCGECLQIHVNAALKAGIAPGRLAAAAGGRTQELPEALSLAFRFGRAVAAGAPEQEELREAALARFGTAAMHEMAFAVALSRFHPAFKRGIGHARSCQAVRLELAA